MITPSAVSVTSTPHFVSSEPIAAIRSVSFSRMKPIPLISTSDSAKAATEANEEAQTPVRAGVGYTPSELTVEIDRVKREARVDAAEHDMALFSGRPPDLGHFAP